MDKRKIFKNFAYIFLFSSLFNLAMEYMKMRALWEMTGGAGDITGWIVQAVVFRVALPVALVIAAHCLDKRRKE